MRQLPIYATAAALLLSTAAIAQQTPAPATPGTTAPTKQMTPPAPGTSAQAPAFITQQMPNQMLASNIIGTSVYGSANESLGEVNDLLMERSGNVTAAVIGVGGFLGVGEKNVAVPFQAIEITHDGKTERLVLRKTKDELKAAPTFAKHDTGPATTGSVGTRPAPMPPGTSPATPPAASPTTPPATNR